MKLPFKEIVLTASIFFLIIGTRCYAGPLNPTESASYSDAGWTEWAARTQLLAKTGTAP